MALLLLCKLAGNLRNHFDPLWSRPLDRFGDGVSMFPKPIGTIEDKCNCGFLAGGLHGPGIVTAALDILRLRNRWTYLGLLSFIELPLGKAFTWWGRRDALRRTG